MLNQQQDTLHVETRVCGRLGEKDVHTITLGNGQMRVELTTIGCAITTIEVPCREGVPGNVVAGFKHVLDYRHNPWYFGCLVGRCAGRIGQGRFELDGRMVQLSVNEGGHHLHGGVEGFNKKVWDIVSLIDTPAEVGVTLQYLSPDGEEGYPGNLRVQVDCLLNTRNELSLHYVAETDQPTPVNLTNHSYFNLSAFDRAQVLDHVLTIPASRYTEKNEQNLPTGTILPVTGTALDFLTPKRIGADIDQLQHDQGLDHNYILRRATAGRLAPAAELYDPVSGRVLSISTDRPAIQVYTANLWDGRFAGPQGQPYFRHGAVALETQAFPDSPNHAQFPSTILMPGDTFTSTTVYAFGVQ